MGSGSPPVDRPLRWTAQRRLRTATRWDGGTGGGERPERRLCGGSNAAPQAARRPALQDPGRRPPGPPHASLILPVAPPALVSGLRSSGRWRAWRGEPREPAVDTWLGATAGSLI